jgi:phage gp46-like protein
MQAGRKGPVVTIRSSQKLFTLDEVARLTGICGDHLLNLAKSKHLGFLARAAEAAGEQAEQWLFTSSDVMILNVLYPRCQHHA